jgi:Xaa-Pro aminopeptidase
VTGKDSFDRLHKDRFNRAKEQLGMHDLGVLVVYDGEDIRYLTGSFEGNWEYNFIIR